MDQQHSPVGCIVVYSLLAVGIAGAIGWWSSTSFGWGWAVALTLFSLAIVYVVGRAIISEYSKYPLKTLLPEITRLSNPNDMPKRIELCQQALRSINRNRDAHDWAALQNSLGVSFFKNPYGDRSENLERAISHYEQALEIMTRETMPEGWAEVMNNIGTVYEKRIEGDRADNLEQAIFHYQQALKVRTKTAIPKKWAETKYNLAGTYLTRIKGNKEENIEQAINHLQETLDVRTRTNTPQKWAKSISGLGMAYNRRVRGERVDNLKQAIHYFEQALEIINQGSASDQWLQITQELEDVYQEYRQYLSQHQENTSNYSGDKLKGAINIRRINQPQFRMSLSAEVRAILLELSSPPTRPGDRDKRIALTQRALELVSRTQNDLLWAVLETELGDSYQEYSQGSRAENLEQAITHYENALEVFTFENFPEDWAMTVNNMANVYVQRSRGNRAENIEQAISYYHQALEVRTHETLPNDWATTMMNLANAYRDRIQGDRAENIELAIDYYNQALEVRTREAMPIDWAATMMNLAAAYVNRIQGDRAKNIEQAIVYYKQALEVFNRETTPIDWARTNHNLAIAYKEHPRSDRDEYLNKAIDCYHATLEIVTREAMPVEWARTTSNLALACYERTPFLAEDKQVANIEDVINYNKQTLDILSRETMPDLWAGIMHNLGMAYAYKSIFGSRDECLGQAITHYQQALEVRRRETVPADYRHTQTNLGNLYFIAQNWAGAEDAYKAAIEAGQYLLEIAYTETGRRAEVAETSQLYARTAYCQLKLGQPAAALLTLEQGKTRLLTEALALAGVDLELLSPAQRQAVETGREAIRHLEAEMRLPPETPARRSDREIAAALAQARSQLNEVIDTIRTNQPDFMPTGLDLPALLALIPPAGALVAPLVTSQGSAVFVIPATQTSVSADHIVWLDAFTDNSFGEILLGQNWKALAAALLQKDIAAVETLLAEGASAGWLLSYVQFLQNSTANRERWFDAMERILAQTRNNLIGPIIEKLTNLGIAPGAPLLLMPQGGLGLLPLHALLLEQYPVTVVPSGYALQTAQQRVTEPGRQAQTLLSVVDPKEDITYVANVAQIFRNLKPKNGQAVSLAKAEATLAAVQTAVPDHTLLDFFCHGQYRWEDPFESGLALADKPLTLKNLITDFDLSTTRLVTLWACETGITDIRQSPDEFVGLPAGFLQAGTPAVISTLWSVNQLSTVLLVEKFYQFYLQDELDIPEALRQAQLWLRKVKARELATCYPRGSSNYRHFSRDFKPDDRPYEHPYYWAAFTFSGA